MNCKTFTIIGLLACGSIGLAACGSNNADSIPPFEPPPPAPPPPPQPQSFTLFVKDLFMDTADNTDPVEINDLDINFDNLDNPRAYDDLLRDN